MGAAAWIGKQPTGGGYLSYIGDFALGSTFDTKFTTVSTTGAPTTIAGTWAISIYVDNSLTQLGPATVATPAAGITISLDFDGVTGMHNVNVAATSGNGYATGKNYQIMVSTGTVGGTSIVGYVVAEFSIQARSSLRPTTAGNTLAVDASGNIILQAVTHTGAVIPTVTALTNDAGITQTGADKVWASATRTLTAFSTALALSIWDVLEASIVTASSIGLKLKGFVFTSAGKVDASLRDWLGTAPSALITGRVDANAQVVGDKTGYAIGTGGIGAGSIGANVFTSAEFDVSATPRIVKNTAINNFMFLMVDSTDHVTPKTGLTWAAGSAQVSIDGAAFANLTNLPVEVSAGIYKINLAAADMNGDVVTLKFTGTAADTRLVSMVTQP